MMKYYLVGNGQLAMAWKLLFEQYQLELILIEDRAPELWHKKITSDQNVSKKPNQKSILFLAVPDTVVFNYSSYLLNNSVSLLIRPIHFSGSLFFHNIEGLHPIMTFGDTSSIDLKNLSFVCDSKNLINDFNKILVKNRFSYIKPNQKELYHTFCSQISNSLPILLEHLWNKMGSYVSLEKSNYEDLVATSIQNWFKNGSKTFSGPLVRNDSITLEKHKSILNKLELSSFYKFIEDSYKEISKEELSK